MSTIQNASQVPLNAQAGTVPNVSGAMTDWFQPMVFTTIVKTTVGFQLVETPTNVNFRGVIQPLMGRRLEMKPEGQRGWNWQLVHSDVSLKLTVDEVITYLGVQARVMTAKDYSLYGYLEYEIVLDYTGAGPNP